MPTQIAQVRVTRLEARSGFLIKCTCGHSATRATRLAADLVAADHQRSHVVQNPADQDWSF